MWWRWEYAGLLSWKQGERKHLLKKAWLTSRIQTFHSSSLEEENSSTFLDCSLAVKAYMHRDFCQILTCRSKGRSFIGRHDWLSDEMYADRVIYQFELRGKGVWFHRHLIIWSGRTSVLEDQREQWLKWRDCPIRTCRWENMFEMKKGKMEVASPIKQFSDGWANRKALLPAFLIKLLIPPECPYW